MEPKINIPPAVEAALQFPILEILVGAVALFWFIFSIIYIYHWVHYGRNPLMTIIVCGLYALISLTLLGFIISQLLYV